MSLDPDYILQQLKASNEIFKKGYDLGYDDGRIAAMNEVLALMERPMKRLLEDIADDVPALLRPQI